VVLYGRETCSVTLMEIYKLRVFANMVVSNLFGSEREKATE